MENGNLSQLWCEIYKVWKGGYMYNLRVLLLREQKRLERIQEKVIDNLKDVPPGTLRVSCGKNWTQYYHCMPDGKKNGKYIPKSEENLIRRLAQKAYDEKILKLTKKRLSQIKRITRDYEEEEIEDVLSKEHMGRQKWIRPVEPTWKQQLEEWMSKDYRRKEFQEDAPIIMTNRGERVRSKSEKILADYFFQKGIIYKYECPLYLKGIGVVHPDFTFLSRKTRQEIYWEHDGRMDDPIYAQNAIRKIQAYEKNGIYPGERLILTFETTKNVLDMELVEKLVSRYLMI